MSKNSPWKKLTSKVVYENKWLVVREDQVLRPDGQPGIYGYVDVHPSVVIIAQDADKKIFLIGQHRYTIDKYSWEFPAGGSEGKNLLLAAKRELEEEIGKKAKYWRKIGELEPLKGYSNEIMAIFFATELEDGLTLATEGDEEISEVKKVTVAQFQQMIAQGQITDGQTIAAFVLVQPY